MIKKMWQYMLNAITHIFSPIHFCVRTLVFLIIVQHPYFPPGCQTLQSARVW